MYVSTFQVIYESVYLYISLSIQFIYQSICRRIKI